MMNKGNKLLSEKHFVPFFLEYTLMGEYQLLQSQHLNGIYVMPSARTPFVWFGIIFIRQGLYQGGVFRFCISIPPNYPNGECPRVIFDNPPFHPMINSHTGELDVKKGFPKWKREVHRIYNVMAFTRRIFFKIDTEAALNTAAADLYKSKLLAFKTEVVASIENSKKHLFDAPKTNDPHELVFKSAESAERHAQCKDAMLKAAVPSVHSSGTSNIPMINGLSWVDRATLSPFGKTS